MAAIKKFIPNKEKLQKIKIFIQKKIQLFKQQINKYAPILKRYKKIIIISGSILVVIIIAILIISGKNPHNAADIKSVKTTALSSKTAAGDYIKQRLKDISDQLVTIRNRLDESGATNFATINRQLASLISEMKELSSESNKMITQQIQKSTAQLKRQLVLINLELSRLQQEQKKIKYLKPAALPFQIISIDNIQQNNVVTLNYNNTTFPIGIDSYVAGWKLIRADFTEQQAEFVNKKSQHVIIDLNRVQERGGIL